MVWEDKYIKANWQKCIWFYRQTAIHSKLIMLLLSYRQQCHRRRWGKRRLEQKHSASDLQPPSHRWRWLLAVHQNDPHKHCTPDLQREKQEPYLTECKINKLLIHATNLTTYQTIKKTSSYLCLMYLGTYVLSAAVYFLYFHLIWIIVF